MESAFIGLAASCTRTSGDLHDCLVYWDAEQTFVLARAAVVLVLIIGQLHHGRCSPYRTLHLTMAAVHLESSCSFLTTRLTRVVVPITINHSLYSQHLGYNIGYEEIGSPPPSRGFVPGQIPARDLLIQQIQSWGGGLLTSK